MDISLKLLAGLPIEVQDNLHIHQFTIREIMKEIGIDKYNLSLSLLLIDEEYIEDVLDSYDLDVVPYEFIIINCINNVEFKTMICDAYKMFCKCDVVFDDEYGILFFTESNPTILNADIYLRIQKILREMHSIPEPEKYVPANDKAKEFIKKLKRNKKNARKMVKSDFTLADIISGVKWKSGETYESVFNLTMYQLYDGLNRLQIIDNYENTMFGIYTGNIDAKNNDIKVNWFKSIDKK